MKHTIRICLALLFIAVVAKAQDAAPVPPTKAGYIIVTDTIPADGKTDVADMLQKLIDDNPKRTIYFPDGVYLLSHPIATPAKPSLSVDLRLSNYAVLKAAPDWKDPEAIVRLGGKVPFNDIRTNGSNYGLTGGIIDLLWYNMSGGIFDIYEIIPGFVLSSIVIIVVSLVTKPEQEMLDEFDSVKTITDFTEHM